MAAKAISETKKGGAAGLAVAVLGLTVLAAGGGLFVGHLIAGRASSTPSAAGSAAAPAGTDIAAVAVRELPPIIANLAAPDGAWLRLQLALVYDKTDAAQMDLIAPKVTDDTLAFVKTLSVVQLQGASGLEHLREDLEDRAAIRSDNRIKDVVIETMVIQ